LHVPAGTASQQQLPPANSAPQLHAFAALPVVSAPPPMSDEYAEAGVRADADFFDEYAEADVRVDADFFGHAGGDASGAAPEPPLNLQGLSFSFSSASLLGLHAQAPHLALQRPPTRPPTP
jgi:hypothetical protein